MAISRYAFNGLTKEGKLVASSTNMTKIFNEVENGRLSCDVMVLEEAQRLDQIAGAVYQNSSYWWVVAAASGIGWGLQVPPGTVIRIPKNVADVLGIIS